MRIPIAFPLIIATAATGLFWHDHNRLAAARKNHTRIVSTAAARGISLSPEQGIVVTKHLRETQEAEIKLLMGDYLSLVKEAQAKGPVESRSDKDLNKRFAKIIRRVMSFDAKGREKLIGEVFSSQELDDEMRHSFVNTIATFLAQEHAPEFLTLVAGSPGFFGNSSEMEYGVHASLISLAKDDLPLAVEWIRTNGKRFPKLVTDNAKSGVIFTAAKTNPKLAFQLVGDLGLDNPGFAVGNIALAARDSEQRTTTLATLREYLGATTDMNERKKMASVAIEHLARSATEEGFETGSKWLAEAGFSTEELGYAAEGVHWNWVKREELGRWIEWLGNTVPDDKGDESIRFMVQFWTQEDHEAAGTWLTTVSEGRAKMTSVQQFAETVAKYEPETAAQWAMTLPAGEKRDSTLKKIYQNWPKNEAAAKAAFAAEHGMK